MAVTTSITAAYVRRCLAGCGGAIMAGHAASGNGRMLRKFDRDPCGGGMTVITRITAQYVINRFGRRVNQTTDTMTAYAAR